MLTSKLLNWSSGLNESKYQLEPMCLGRNSKEAISILHLQKGDINSVPETWKKKSLQ